MDALLAFYTEDVEWDQTRYGPADMMRVYRGRPGVRRFFREWLEGFSDYFAEPTEFIDAGDDAVIVTVRQGGRGKRSGASVEMPLYWAVYRMSGGRVARVEIHPSEPSARAAGESSG